MMAGLAASHLRHEKNVSPEELSITVVSPEPQMVIRPRLYERDPHTMVAPLTDVFAVTDINHVRGFVETIGSATNTIGDGWWVFLGRAEGTLGRTFGGSTEAVTR